MFVKVDGKCRDVLDSITIVRLYPRPISGSADDDDDARSQA